MTPKGILVSIGGAEDKGTDLELGIFTRNILNFMEMGILKNIVQNILLQIKKKLFCNGYCFD